MKITNRFIEPIPLDEYITDAKDGRRVAVRPWEQTFYGTKTFENMRLDSDPDKGDKSLVNVHDMNEALAEVGNPVTVTDVVVLIEQDIANNGTTLTYEPQAGSVVKMSIKGSGECNSIVDFTVNGKSVSWANNAYLRDILMDGDELHFRYFTVKKE